MMQSAAIVTTGHCKSRPGRISFTHGKKHDKISSSNKSLRLGKFAKVEQLQLSVVTCTAFPYVTLHSQPFPITRLVAVLCYTCYFVPPNGLGALPICLCSCDAP